MTLLRASRLKSSWLHSSIRCDPHAFSSRFAHLLRLLLLMLLLLLLLHATRSSTS